MSNLTWLFIAMLAVWLVIGGYLLSIALRQRSLERRLDRLEPSRGNDTDSDTV